MSTCHAYEAADVCGCAVAMQNYDVLLFVGGGIGLAPLVSVLADLVNKMQTSTCCHCGKVCHKYFTLRLSSGLCQMQARQNPSVASHVMLCLGLRSVPRHTSEIGCSAGVCR